MESVTDSDDYTSEDKKRKHAESLSPFKAVKKLNRAPQKKRYKGDIEEVEDIREMLRTVIGELKGIRLENKEFRDEVAAMRKENEYLRGRLLVTENKERSIQKCVRTKGKELKEEGKDVKIGYRKLIIDGETWVWSNDGMKRLWGKNEK
nr:unnamed protein product [Callosobruchus analis]